MLQLEKSYFIIIIGNQFTAFAKASAGKSLCIKAAILLPAPPSNQAQSPGLELQTAAPTGNFGYKSFLRYKSAIP